ncbi:MULTISPECIES: DUF2975 domain-containing protein [Microbacterium]|jgi:hypothetical protein|uniref:DUF2975 domain-containing protein n=1 Tax=Microbacterium TaxID=33882 RepID=UPI000CFB43C1|nr:MULTISPECIES: DUF2975 domain-containing protein [unclassified Microbacterium]PRB10567.1 hypothetical protein CQ047_07195 [Microbacterium sp. MYb72]
MQPHVTRILKALIVLLLGLLLASQILVIPEVARITAIRNPDVAQLEVPGIIGAVLFLGLVEVTLVCIWFLLSLVQAERIFRVEAFRYVDVILAALVSAGALILASFIVIVASRAVSLSLVLLAVLGIVVSAALALLVVVLRGLLRKALELEQDLSEVV